MGQAARANRNVRFVVHLAPACIDPGEPMLMQGYRAQPTGGHTEGEIRPKGFRSVTHYAKRRNALRVARVRPIKVEPRVLHVNAIEPLDFTITVSGPPMTEYGVESLSPWIIVDDATVRIGYSPVIGHVQPNTTEQERVGYIEIAKKKIKILQNGL